MSVRKRQWTTRKGEQREAWVVAYADQDGDRHIETFRRKKEADARHDQVRQNVREGVHTAPTKSITVAAAAKQWLDYVRGEKREPTTVMSYDQHIRLHIAPRLGAWKLANLTGPKIEAVRDELVANLSRPMAKKVLQTLKAILKDAKRRGNVAQNVAADVSVTIHGRSKPRLEIGKDIPAPDEIRRILAVAPQGRARALLITAALTGLRASELRGLRWEDVNLKHGKVTVKQRADRFNTLGPPKSATSHRTLPIGQMVVNTLREWKLQCPKGEGDLVFPNGNGSVAYLENITERILKPALIAAGVVDGSGRAKYSIHSLRHFYASWCINRKADGGLELPPKTVQTRLGHASIVITLDRYGHLFKSHDDGAELTAAETALFAT
jgi:integrase